MKKIIPLGIAAALFFSITFAINRWLNFVEGGHWYWTASLRYIYTAVLISILIIVKYGFRTFSDTLRCFARYWYFWLLAGGVGFGCFYLFLCYAASYSPGWVLATTWQLTILMTPVVLWLFRDKVGTRGILYLALMFVGILLVNYHQFSNVTSEIWYSVLPIAAAAFCYPFGNTLCKFACEGKLKRFPINTESVATNVFSQVLLMVLGALPVLFVVGIIVRPSAPTNSQLYSIVIIAIFTGVIATSLLYKARQLASNAFELAAADGTQAGEPPLALFWEIVLFGATIPSAVGFTGLALVIIGIVLFYRSNIRGVSN